MEIVKEGGEEHDCFESGRKNTCRRAPRAHFAPAPRPQWKDRRVSGQREAGSTWKSQAGMLGVRLTFRRGRQRTWLTDGTADWFWEAAERYGIPAMVFAPDEIPKVGEIAARHPGLRLIIDHLGLSSDVKGAPLGPFIDRVLELARYGNVAVKASGLLCYVAEAYPFPSLHAQILAESSQASASSLPSRRVRAPSSVVCQIS